MRFERNSQNWNTIEQGEKDCFLLTNGLGGYSSLSVIGSLARGDQALLMSAQKAPNVRRHLISNYWKRFRWMDKLCPDFPENDESTGFGRIPLFGQLFL